MYFDSNTQPASVARVQVGIDAAVVAHHHVCVRAFAADGDVNVSRFQVPPTLTGLRTLTKRLAPYPGVLAVAEPTSLTWLGLAVALQDPGSDLALVGFLAAARRPSLTAEVAEHTRGVGDVPARVEEIRSTAAAWAHFWDGHLDLDALAWDVSEHLADMAVADARIDWVTAATQRYWEQLYGDGPLLSSMPG